MNKVFFKGFPFYAKKSDVKTVFEQFGTVEYIYFMCEPKRTRHPCKMGYVVFESRNPVDLLFNLGGTILFHNQVITCQEYHNTKKSRREGADYISKDLSPKRPLRVDKNYPTRENSLGLVNSPSFRTINSQSKNPKEIQNVKSKFSRPVCQVQKVKVGEAIWLSSTKEIEENSAKCQNLRFNLRKSTRSLQLRNFENAHRWPHQNMNL